MIPIMTPKFDYCNRQLPVTASVFLTHYCNLRCSFCCYRPLQETESRDLNTDQWMKIIDELAELKIFQIKILAGEPLIRHDFKTLLQHIVRCGMRFTLNTNGTLLTEDIASFIAGTKRADEVQVSLDGLEKQHDEIRGKGNWRKAVNAVKLLEELGVPVKINMVLTTSNYHSCNEAGRFFLEELGVKSLRISSVSDQFSELEPAHGKLSDRQYVQAMLQILELKKQYPNLTSSFLDRHRQINHPCNEAGCRRCSTPYKSITILADGAVAACPNAPGYILGWCGRDNLREIWQTSQVLADFRKQIDAGMALDGECQECEYIWYCRQCCPPAHDRGRGRCLKHLKQLLKDYL